MSDLALFGGAPAKRKPFPVWPQYDALEEQLLLEVLHSRRWWRTQGTKTAEFERQFAAWQQSDHGIAVTNGTHALEVALAALGIGPGDEVIVPDSTFVATAGAVLFTGALPVPVDVERDTFNLDPDQAQAAITERTRAIIAVHLGGMPADLGRLTDLCEQHGLALVEDCAHAHGSEWAGRRIGAFGAFGTFSFQSSKTMTAGEGGIILTNDPVLERQARSVHDCGRLPGEWFYSHFQYGSNYRLSEWQGAILLAQLTRAEEQTARRDHNARLLDSLFAGIEGFTPQARRPQVTRNGSYAYILRHDRARTANVPTKRIIEAVIAEGVPNQATYPPIHALELIRNGRYKERLTAEAGARGDEVMRGPFPNAQRAYEEAIWIPQAALLGDEEDMHEIAAAFDKVARSAPELA
jgi:dTDP-4-amino-4,6-dideoxygalactose transaminase